MLPRNVAVGKNQNNCIMTQGKLRWGILSTAQIARKNWKAIRNSGNSTVVAVASRDMAKCQRFIESCQCEAPMESVPQSFGSYQELLASPNVDAVYIPLPTGLRKEWVIRAAQSGKHVVCEKPCAVGLNDLKEMVDACKANGVQFMDGVMFMHSRRLDKIREVLDQKEDIGQIKRIATSFSFRADDNFYLENIRANSLLEPHGCLGDLGWYCIRFALWVMNEELPHRVVGRILSSSQGDQNSLHVPTEFSGELYFSNGVSSGFYCSFLVHDDQSATINGTAGYLHLADFVVPFFGNEVSFRIDRSALNVVGCDFYMEARRPEIFVNEYSSSHATAQETNLFRNFVDQVRSGNLNAQWPEIALNTQKIMQACYESAVSGGVPVHLSSGI